MPTLHIAIPFYNEPATLEPCLQRVVDAPLPPGWTAALELVDDCSTDDAGRAAGAIVDRMRGAGAEASIFRHAENHGKGAALATAFDRILADAGEDDLVTIQDADLEYDPRDLAALMAPILAGRADATIGDRFHGAAPERSVAGRIHTLGNRLLSSFSNLLTGYRLSDMECCYKVLPVPLLRRVRPMLNEPRFGIEPQLVAALARVGARLEEVPVRYEARGFEAGKKIGWRDGMRALWVIARERRRGARGSAAA